MLPRFVILEHTQQSTHWDFMLESNGVLLTWRLEQPPMAGEETAAERTFDHRLMYLDYEGPVSGGRGHVRRWDSGVYEGEVGGETPWQLALHGGQWSGTVVLKQVDAKQWRLTFIAGGAKAGPEAPAGPG